MYKEELKNLIEKIIAFRDDMLDMYGAGVSTKILELEDALKQADNVLANPETYWYIVFKGFKGRDEISGCRIFETTDDFSIKKVRKYIKEESKLDLILILNWKQIDKKQAKDFINGDAT